MFSKFVKESVASDRDRVIPLKLIKNAPLIASDLKALPTLKADFSILPTERSNLPKSFLA